MSVRWVTEAEWNELKGTQVPQKSSTKITLFLDIVPGTKCWLCYNPESGLLIEAQTPKEAQENFMKCVSEGKMRERATSAEVAAPVSAPATVAVLEVDAEAVAASLAEPEPAAPVKAKPGRRPKAKKVEPVVEAKPSEEDSDDLSFGDDD